MNSPSSSLPSGLPSVRRATVELFFAGALWGFTFVAQRYSMEAWGPLTVLAIRFAAASLISLPFLFMRSIRCCNLRSEARGSLVPGLLLGAVLALQNYGLRLTSVANSSFITTLYVVFVPIVDSLFFGQSSPRGHYRVVALALLGTALMCEVHHLQVNLGDLFILGCAILSAFQISWIGRAASKIQSPFAFNTFQSFWIGLISIPLALVVEGLPSLTTWAPRATLGLVYQTVGATLISFLIQVRAQRVLPTSTASILFLLEAPFAAVFGFLAFGERLSLERLAGAGIILVACAWAVLEKREPPTQSQSAQ